MVPPTTSSRAGALRDSYWLCDIRDPEEIIVELAEKIG
jgi:hypothetical protein